MLVYWMFRVKNRAFRQKTGHPPMRAAPVSGSRIPPDNGTQRFYFPETIDRYSGSWIPHFLGGYPVPLVTHKGPFDATVTGASPFIVVPVRNPGYKNRIFSGAGQG